MDEEMKKAIEAYRENVKKVPNVGLRNLHFINTTTGETKTIHVGDKGGMEFYIRGSSDEELAQEYLDMAERGGIKTPIKSTMETLEEAFLKIEKNKQGEQ